MNGMGAQLSHRKQLYAGPLSKLRLLMISRMAKPEEVLIVEDENGNIVRETMKDNDVLVQYKVPLFGFFIAFPGGSPMSSHFDRAVCWI